MREAVRRSVMPVGSKRKTESSSFVREKAWLTWPYALSILAESGPFRKLDSNRYPRGAATMYGDGTISALVETRFWRSERFGVEKGGWLSPRAVVALTKCFVLEWSFELDYRMYHDLPMDILFG